MIYNRIFAATERDEMELHPEQPPVLLPWANGVNVLSPVMAVVNSISRNSAPMPVPGFCCSPRPVLLGSPRPFLRIGIRRNWCAKPCRTKLRRPMTTAPLPVSRHQDYAQGSTTRLYVETREATAGFGDRLQRQTSDSRSVVRRRPASNVSSSIPKN